MRKLPRRRISGEDELTADRVTYAPEVLGCYEMVSIYKWKEKEFRAILWNIKEHLKAFKPFSYFGTHNNDNIKFR